MESQQVVDVELAPISLSLPVQDELVKSLLSDNLVEVLEGIVPVQDELVKTLEEDPIKIIMKELLAFKLVSVVLTEKEMMIVKIIVQQSPSMIDDINQCVLDIVKDGKIDSNDIPSFIKLIKSVYVFCHEAHNIKININEIAKMIGPIVKYIVHIVLSKNGKSTPELVKCCDNLIDISVEMIQLQSTTRTKMCNFAIC